MPMRIAKWPTPSYVSFFSCLFFKGYGEVRQRFDLIVVNNQELLAVINHVTHSHALLDGTTLLGWSPRPHVTVSAYITHACIINSLKICSCFRDPVAHSSIHAVHVYVYACITELTEDHVYCVKDLIVHSSVHAVHAYVYACIIDLTEDPVDCVKDPVVHSLQRPCNPCQSSAA